MLCPEPCARKAATRIRFKASFASMRHWLVMWVMVLAKGRIRPIALVRYAPNQTRLAELAQMDREPGVDRT